MTKESKLLRELHQCHKPTYDHCLAVGKLIRGYYEHFGLILDFDPNLHDIGKLLVRTAALDGIQPLYESDAELMKNHPINGAEMLKENGFDPKTIAVARGHHERWDGSGYPDHLVGSQISFEQSLVAFFDCYHAMTSDDPYRSNLPHAKAVAQLKASFLLYNPLIFDKAIAFLNSHQK